MGTQQSSAKGDPVVVGQRLIHSGKKFDFVSLTVQRTPGAAKTIDREFVRHPGAVVVVPILEPEGGRPGPGGVLEHQVVLIRNFRIAAGESLLECCAGTIERARRADGSFGDGEAPEVCAARELVEETGYRAARLVSLGWFYTSPGMSDERMHAFVATGLTHIGQKLEEDETIEVVKVTVREAAMMARDCTSGRMRDAKSMVALVLAEQVGWGVRG